MAAGLNSWYVYTLADPRDGAVFYVGKGKGNRAWQHEAGVRNGRPDGNARKGQLIREVLVARLDKEISAHG